MKFGTRLSSIVRRSVVNLAAASFTLALVITPALGGIRGHISVTIPFAFSAGKSELPAGAYTVTPVREGVLAITSDDGDRAMIVTRIESNAYAGDAVPTLVFNRYGDQCFLSEVRSGWDSTSYMLRASRPELKLASVGNAPKDVLLVKASAR